jgi:hypothetical protein
LNVEAGRDFNSKIEIYIDTLLKQDVAKKYIARQKEIKSIKDNFKILLKVFLMKEKKKYKLKL